MSDQPRLLQAVEGEKVLPTRNHIMAEQGHGTPTRRFSFVPSPTSRFYHFSTHGVETWAAGWAEGPKGLLDSVGLATTLCHTLTAGADLDCLLQKLKGNFAFVWNGPLGPGAAADQVRSFPLVYSCSTDEVLVSDDPWQIGAKTSALDYRSMAEYATAGFVSGQRTVFANIDALQAGERVFFTASGPKLNRYYKYLCSYDSEQDTTALCAELDRVTMAALERTVASVGNRQIVIPLSAGLDSRLIAAGLKRMGRDNILCISYGILGNHDAEGARTQAKKLGFDWQMIPYDSKQLRTLLDSVEMRQFWRTSSCGISMPFLSDYPALEFLRRKEIIEPDAVFMPGQSGDFIAGTHLKYLFDLSKNPETDPVQAIIDKHYLMWERLMERQQVREAVLTRIAESLAGLPVENETDRARAYEYWEWQERQCKHVINESRSFEFFGYDWRMPLWDLDIMEYWKSPTIEHKLGAYLYREYLATVNPGGVFTHERLDGPVQRCNQASLRHKCRPTIFLPLVSSLLRWQKRYRKHKKTFKYTPTGFPQAYGKFRYLFLEADKRHDGSLLLKDFLKETYGIRIDEL